jgi:dTDP-4-amino-4,6-dideoxygalactose transaminase
MKPIPYGRQNITQADIDAVVETLKSDFLTQGPKIKEFEDAFANYIGSKYAVAVSNGTAALHLSALALGVKPGDKVITTPITFAASANCVRYAGGEVVFADINPETYLLDINEVEKQLKADPQGTYKGIIPVDLAGRAVDLEAFRKLADKYGCWLLEDACHAPGGYFMDSNGKKQNCGNGNFAELAIFSFHPVKHIAAGEGGMITTNDEKLYQKLLTLRTHGITKDASLFQNTSEFALGNAPNDPMTKNDARSANDPMTSNDARSANDPMATNDARSANNPMTTNDARSANNPMTREAQNDYPGWYYEMQTLGFNYRITDFQAALGLSQLKRADEGLAKRKEIAHRYDKAFAGMFKSHKVNDPMTNDLMMGEGQNAARSANDPMTDFDSGHAYHLYIIEVDDRKGLYDHLRENNIFSQVHYIPVHLMPYYRQFGWKDGDMPNAENYYSNCLSLPMYPTLTKKEQQFVIKTINSFFNQNP